MSNRNTDESDELKTLRAKFESLANDSFGFRRSHRGTYMNPAVARDWKWFQLGAAANKKDDQHDR
jgi:hypothetical protein